MNQGSVKLFRDAQGDPRAEWKDKPVRGEYFTRFLEGDLAGDAVQCELYIAEARNVATGKSKGFRATGNAFTVKLTPKYATLYSNADDQSKPLSLPLADFTTTVKRWQKLIAT